MFGKSKKLEEFFGKKLHTKAHIKQKGAKYGVEWQEYSNVDKCNRCEKTFTPLRRKHHCRSCGLIYCAGCTSARLFLEGSENRKRVCRKCAPTVVAEADSSAGKKNGFVNSAIQKPTKRASVFDIITGKADVEDDELEQFEEATKVSIFFDGELETDAKLTCYFDACVKMGQAVWYKVTESDDREIVFSEAVVMAQDSMYEAKKSDVGFRLQCELRQGNTPAMQNAAEPLVAITVYPVRTAMASLAGISAQIGLRPHVHSLKCDRTTRVCEAPGKYREGECLYMEPKVRGIERGGDVFLVFRWLRSKQRFDKYGNLMDRPGIVGIGEGGEKEKVVAIAQVMHDFTAQEKNELSVSQGDLLLYPKKFDDGEWILALGPNGTYGAVPRSYVRISKRPVDNIDSLFDPVKGPDVYGEDERIAREWRRLVFHHLDFETVEESDSQGSNKVMSEYRLGKSDLDRLIVCELELFRKVGKVDVEPIGKAVRSMPVGTIEAAPPRIEDVKIIGDASVGSVLCAQYIYYGGRESTTTFSWVRVNPNGTREIVRDTEARTLASTPGKTRRKSLHSEGGKFLPSDPRAYTLTEADFGAKLKVIVTPVRDDGREGKPTSSAAFRVSPRDANTCNGDEGSPIVTAGKTQSSNASMTSNRIQRLKKARASVVNNQ